MYHPYLEGLEAIALGVSLLVIVGLVVIGSITRGSL